MATTKRRMWKANPKPLRTSSRAFQGIHSSKIIADGISFDDVSSKNHHHPRDSFVVVF